MASIPTRGPTAAMATSFGCVRGSQHTTPRSSTRLTLAGRQTDPCFVQDAVYLRARSLNGRLYVVRPHQVFGAETEALHQSLGVDPVITPAYHRVRSGVSLVISHPKSKFAGDEASSFVPESGKSPFTAVTGVRIPLGTPIIPPLPRLPRGHEYPPRSPKRCHPPPRSRRPCCRRSCPSPRTRIPHMTASSGQRP